MTFKVIVLLIAVVFLTPLILDDSFAQIVSGSSSNSSFDRDFGDIKYIDAYFGTPDRKIQVDGGDENVPFTVVLVNIGSNDITGISGQLSLPLGFSPSSGSNTIIYADSDSSALAGADFYLTFSVNIDKNVEIREYPGTIKVDYSRLRESGIRTMFATFDFKVTGDSVINVKSVEPFLTSLTSNDIVIEITNDGTAPISSVSVAVANTQSDPMMTSPSSSSDTNVENIVMSDSSWQVGNIGPKSTTYITTNVYVPESLKGDTLHIPLSITYYDTYGEERQILKSADFFVQGLIDLTIFNVNVIELSETQVIVGEVINEGNEGGLFGFVTIDPGDNSNIKSNTQFIDEIDTDAPVPFNVPIEFDGEPRYGEHDITVTLRYKDSLRDEIFLTHDQTIFISEPVVEDAETIDPNMIIIGGIIVAVIIAAVAIKKSRKNTDDE